MVEAMLLHFSVNSAPMQKLITTTRPYWEPTIRWALNHPRTTLTVGVLGLGVGYWYQRRRLTNLPPGPLGVPVFGEFFNMSDDMHLDCMEMAKKYGDVFSFQIGPK